MKLKRCSADTDIPAKKSCANMTCDLSFEELSFFDKVKTLLQEPEVYRNFLQCLNLFSISQISQKELMWIATKFIGKRPDLLDWFKNRLKFCEFKELSENSNASSSFFEIFEPGRHISATEFDIDYSAAKLHTYSYRPLPENFEKPSCSGQASCEIYQEVLNDFCTSFPSWQSEDSSLVSSKKTLHEQCIYRIEDERFELDIVIELNKSAIQSLENVRKRMSRLSETDAQFFKLDENLGGKSNILQTRALKRVYGDKAFEIIEGLMMNPHVAVPLVLNRLRAKESEWKEAQKRFEKVWAEQQRTSYNKSVEHDWCKVKQNDLKQLRLRTLLNHVEVLHDEEKMIKSDTNDLLLTSINFAIDNGILKCANELFMTYLIKNPQGGDTADLEYFLQVYLPMLLGHNVLSCTNENYSNPRFNTDSETLTFVNVTVNDLNYLISNNVTVLFAPEPFYIFLRIYSNLLERLESCLSDCIGINDINRFTTMILRCKQYLNSEIDSTTFETMLLTQNLQSGAHLQIIDRTLSYCIRQIILLINDEKSMKSHQLYFDFYLKRQSIDNDDVELENQHTKFLHYEKEVAAVFGNQVYFKFSINHVRSTVSVNLIHPKRQFTTTLEKSGLFAHYLETFVSNNSTDLLLYGNMTKSETVIENVDVKVCPVFLKRNMKKSSKLTLEQIMANYYCKENLTAKISKTNQQMRYVCGTFDIFVKIFGRLDPYKRKLKMEQTARFRAFKYLKWMYYGGDEKEQKVKILPSQTDQCEKWFLMGNYANDEELSETTKFQMEKFSEKCDKRPFCYRRTFYLLTNDDEELGKISRPFSCNVQCEDDIDSE